MNTVRYRDGAPGAVHRNHDSPRPATHANEVGLPSTPIASPASCDTPRRLERVSPLADVRQPKVLRQLGLADRPLELARSGAPPELAFGLSPSTTPHAQRRPNGIGAPSGSLGSFLEPTRPPRRAQ